MAEEDTIIEEAEEEKRLMRLEEQRRAQEMTEEEEKTEEGTIKPPEEHFINTGEAALLLAFTGAGEGITWLLDFIPFAGWVISIIAVTAPVGGILLIWMTGKVAKGAPKNWYRAIYWGAVGGAIPIIPGYLGSIIWLLMQDRKILSKIGGKLGETLGKIAAKA